MSDIQSHFLAKDVSLSEGNRKADARVEQYVIVRVVSKIAAKHSCTQPNLSCNRSSRATFIEVSLRRPHGQTHHSGFRESS